LGTVAAVMNEDGSPYVSVGIAKRPPYSYNVTCGNSTTVYCIKDTSCYPVSFANQTSICHSISVDGKKSELPVGVGTRIGEYQLPMNTTVDARGNFTVEFRPFPPEPIFTAVRWCEDGVCNGSRIIHKIDNREAVATSIGFVQMYETQGKNKELRSEIAKAVERLNAYVSKVDSQNIEATYPVTDEIRQKIAEVTTAAENDGLEALPASKLHELQNTVTSAAKSLHFTIEG
jgi:hypothetical protein